LLNFSKGDPVKMYGVLIGKAVSEIKKGTLLTTENFKTPERKN